MSGYAQGEEEYNAMPTTHESEENDIDEFSEPDDYESDRCSEQEFTCKNNSQCINLDQRCDGTRHCIDGSDESDCDFNKKGD